MEDDVLILAIESSCDETAAAVVKNGRIMLSNIISSQIALHTLYGGVVPEIASRLHIDAISNLYKEALKQGKVTYITDQSAFVQSYQCVHKVCEYLIYGTKLPTGKNYLPIQIYNKYNLD